MKIPPSKPKVIAIVGPTATGKSDLAVFLAQKINGEIISADSRQVYKGLNIGSGKITKMEMKGVPHHLLSIVLPKRVYAVSDYTRDGSRVLQLIEAKKKTPIVVGGSGMYIDSLLRGMKIPEVPPNLVVRKKLELLATEKLYEILKKLDPERAKTIDPHNPRRLVRAIEIANALGSVPSLDLTGRNDLEVIWVGISVPPEKLKKRIKKRLLSRLKQGMVAEVRNLHASGVTWKRLYDLGLEYRYISLYLRKKITKNEMLETLEKEIYQYAKRQTTWFKRNNEIQWFNQSENTRILNMVRSFLKTTSL